MGIYLSKVIICWKLTRSGKVRVKFVVGGKFHGRAKTGEAGFL